MIVALVLAMTSVAAPAPHVANSAQAAASRLNVGATGILCAQTPCPSRGVFEPGSGLSTSDSLFYVDLYGEAPPPPMTGAGADLSAVRSAWADRRCLSVEGRLIPGEDDRPVLRVDRIIGACEN